MGSNRQFIEEVISHIGSLLCDDVWQVLDHRESSCLHSGKIVVDLVNLLVALVWLPSIG